MPDMYIKELESTIHCILRQHIVLTGTDSLGVLTTGTNASNIARTLIEAVGSLLLHLQVCLGPFWA